MITQETHRSEYSCPGSPRKDLTEKPKVNLLHPPSVVTVSAPNRHEPGLLQQFLSQNALINAFMGANPSSNSSLLVENMTSADNILHISAADAKVLKAIESCFDVETLTNGLAADLDVLLTTFVFKNNNDDASALSVNYSSSRKPMHCSLSEQKRDTPRSINGDDAKEVITEEQNRRTTGSFIISSALDSSPTTSQTQDEDTVQEQPLCSRTFAARLSRVKFLLYNERKASHTSHHRNFFKSFSSPSQCVTIASALFHVLLKNDLVPTLLKNLHFLPFEARKDVASIFNYLLVCGCVTSFGGLEECMEEEVGESYSSTMGNFSEACIISYAETMNAFATYIKQNFVAVMTPIIVGHDIGNVNWTNENLTTSDDDDDKLSRGSCTCIREIDRRHERLGIVKTPDVALLCGSMLRATLRHPVLYSELVSREHAPKFVYPFLDSFVNQPNFEVASDALETFRLILTGGGGPVIPYIQSPTLQFKSPAELESDMENIASSFLERAYTPIFDERFNPKLLNGTHANYITRRVSLQLISTILLTRSNYKVMIRYVSSRSNLITVMVLLRDSSAHITLDAFNIFKVFVVNPNKPPEVIRILADNKVKLVKYLSGLHKDKEQADEQFRDEKELVIYTLEALQS